VSAVNLPFLVTGVSGLGEAGVVSSLIKIAGGVPGDGGLELTAVLPADPALKLPAE